MKGLIDPNCWSRDRHVSCHPASCGGDAIVGEVLQKLLTCARSYVLVLAVAVGGTLQPLAFCPPVALTPLPQEVARLGGIGGSLVRVDLAHKSLVE